jgi:hypothetical protein
LTILVVHIVGRNFAAIAEAQQSQKVRLLFSKYECINNSIISDFVSSIPDNFSDAFTTMLDTCTAYSTNDFIMKNRTRLQKFHIEANTMSSAVGRKLTLLTHPTTKIFVSARQPNLFPYGGVFKIIVLLQSLKDRIEKHEPDMKTLNLFLIADHDFIWELWIHYAQLPSVRHSSGILELRMPVSNWLKRKMMYNIPLPGSEILVLCIPLSV